MKEGKTFGKPIPFRCRKANAGVIEEIMEVYGLDNRNQTINFIIENWGLVLDIRRELMDRGLYTLNWKTIKHFRIK